MEAPAVLSKTRSPGNRTREAAAAAGGAAGAPWAALPAPPRTAESPRKAVPQRRRKRLMVRLRTPTPYRADRPTRTLPIAIGVPAAGALERALLTVDSGARTARWEESRDIADPSPRLAQDRKSVV